MYKTSKSISILSLAVSLVVFFSTVFTLPVLADENYGNVPPDANMMMSMSEMESIVLTFDPNDYTFLVYNPGGSLSSIVAAMTNILGAAFDPNTDVRTSSNPVTPDDLATYDILIVGSNFGGYTTGLDANTLLAGITGRAIITGHDADWHSVNDLKPRAKQAAEKFLVNDINYVLAGSGKGMITLADTQTPNPFSYLPAAWGVSAQFINPPGEDINKFTPEALASGVYDNLDPCDMSNWYGTYHDILFINSGSLFVSFELGGNTGNDIITVARDYLAPLSPLSISKTDNASGGRVKPGDRLTYTINYNYRNNDPNWTITLHNVVLTDYLPAEVLDTNVVRDHNGVYDSTTRTVTWTLGILNPGDSNSVTVAVTVGNTRPSTGYLRNTAKIRAADTNEATAIRRTWWYKVHNVTKDLWYDMIQTAITYTDNNDVLVAYPGVYIENVIFDCNVLTLQSSDPNNPFIVSQTVISAYGGNSYNTVAFDNNSTVNGFTIADGYDGVYCYGSSCRPTVKNCVIRNNTNGVYCGYASAPAVANCVIRNNSGVGVYCAGSSAPTIAGCIVKNNQYGIFCSGAGQVKIINNWIVNNGYYGIYITTSNELTIRNNTISKNNSAGIYRAGGTDPNISNSIFWYNGSSHTTDFVGTFTKVNYCRISAERPGSTGNILSDPCFVDVNAGNYHIKAVSLCRNAGDPNTTLVSGETDIDGQPRRNGTARAVDIGADEYYGGSDLNGDGQVNFLDYAIFANAWKTYQGSAKWNAACDFIDDNDINNLDLAWFAQAWPFPPAGQQQSMMQQTEPEALEHFSSTL